MKLGSQCIRFRILVNPFSKKGFHVHSLQRITIFILRATSKSLLKKPFPTNIFFLTRTQCCPRWKSKILYPFYQGANSTRLRTYGQKAGIQARVHDLFDDFFFSVESRRVKNSDSVPAEGITEDRDRYRHFAPRRWHPGCVDVPGLFLSARHSPPPTPLPPLAPLLILLAFPSPLSASLCHCLWDVPFSLPLMAWSLSLSLGRWFLFLRVLIRVGGRSPPP